MVNSYQIFLESSSIHIPTFVAKLISNLSLIKRSSGDVYHYSVNGITTLTELKEHFTRILKILLSIDFINEIPVLSGRYRSNDICKDLVSKIFSRLIDATD